MAEDFSQKDSVAFRLCLKSFFFFAFFPFYFRLVNSNSNAVCIESYLLFAYVCFILFFICEFINQLKMFYELRRSAEFFSNPQCSQKELLCLP